MELFAAHNNWASRPADERFESLEAMHAALKDRRDRSWDANLDLRRVTPQVLPDRLMLHHGALDLTLTHYAAGAFLAKIGAPREFLTTIDTPLASSVIENRIERYLLDEQDDQSHYQRTLITSNGDAVARAFHGSRYERLWDDEVMSLLIRNLPDGWRNPVAYKNGEWGAELVPSGLYASDRDMFAFLIDGGDCLDLGERAQLHRGMFVWNSETGYKRFGFQAFWFNRVCGNNIVWGATETHVVQARHTKNVRHAFQGFGRFLDVLKNEDGRDSIAKGVKAAQETIFASLAAEERVATLAKLKRAGFTSTETTQAIDAIRQEERSADGTAWDWVQGYTAVARTKSYVEDRVDLERRAGGLLTLATK